MLKIRNYYLGIIVINLVFLVSCNSGVTDQNKEGNATVSLQIEGDLSGEYIVEKRLTRERIAIDTLKLDPKGTAVFGLEVEGIEIFSIKNPLQQSEIIFVANQGDEMKIKASSNDIGASFSLSGTIENESLSEFIEYERSFQAFTDSINKVYLNLKRSNQHFGVEAQFNALYKEKAIAHENYVKTFIDKDPERFINLLVVRSLDIKRHPEYYKKVKEGLENKFPASEHVMAFAKDVGRLAASEVGGIAPAFSLPTYKGTSAKLSDYKGKYVLLDFWATWCKPCIAEIPNLKRVKEEFVNEDFEIVSVCVDRADFKSNWKKIIEKHQTNWPQLFDASGTTARDYAIEYFPTIFLLNKKGEIVARNLRGHDIAKKLREVFADQ